MIEITHNADTLLLNLGRRLQQMPEQIDAALGRGAQEVAVEARVTAPKAHSVLTNSILARRNGLADYSVVAGVRHARYVEDGTGPGGTPPLQALVDWIRVKRIEPNDPDMSREQLARLFQRSIARKGTPKQPFLRPALENKAERIRVLVEQAILRGLG